MKQGSLKVKVLPRNPYHVELEQGLSYEQLPLYPRQFAPQTDTRTEAERVQAFYIVLTKYRIVQRMVSR